MGACVCAPAPKQVAIPLLEQADNDAQVTSHRKSTDSKQETPELKYTPVKIEHDPQSEPKESKKQNVIQNEPHETDATATKPEIKENKENILLSQSTDEPKYVLQVDRMRTPSRKSYVWILDKDRNLQPMALDDKIKRSSLVVNPKQYLLTRRVTLTDSHNFVWLTLILDSSQSRAEKISEISKTELDRILDLLPKPFRSKIWDIVNVDKDTFIVAEEYVEFVVCCLIATAQYDIEKDAEDVCPEFRDMSKIFYQVVHVDQLFSNPKYANHSVSKSDLSLSREGAIQVIKLLRNLDDEKQIVNELALPLLTGFTQKAIQYSVSYCTRIFWRILTGVYWDEEDAYDIPLPDEIEEYQISARESVRSTQMQDLFGDLYCQVTYDIDDDEQEQQQYMKSMTLELPK